MIQQPKENELQVNVVPKVDQKPSYYPNKKKDNQPKQPPLNQ